MLRSLYSLETEYGKKVRSGKETRNLYEVFLEHFVCTASVKKSTLCLIKSYEGKELEYQECKELIYDIALHEDMDLNTLKELKAYSDPPKRRHGIMLDAYRHQRRNENVD